MIGGRGNDTLHGGPGDDSVSGGLGDDTLDGDGGSDTITGGHGRDDIDGGPGNGDIMRGDIGFDTLEGGPGEEDIASFSTASAPVDADLMTGTAHGDGRDTIGSGTEDLVGSSYPDTLIGDPGPNRIDGGAGYDELEGRGGDDELIGGPDGADCSAAAETEACEKPKATGAGDVVVYSRSLDGGAVLAIRGTDAANDLGVALSGGNFVVTDSAGPIPPANVTGCEASGGPVSCPGDAKFILVDGGGGPDRITIDGSVPPSVEIRIEGGTGADELIGGSGDDVIEAGDDSDPDRLEGGGGDDALIGARTDIPVPFSSGKSTLIGGAGSDVMVGGDPCDGDVFDGGQGNDDANFFRFTPGVKAEIGGAVTRSGGPCTPGRIDASVEEIEGSPGDDTLVGSNNGDTLIGKSGDDTLLGRGGNDSLDGGPGNDRLDGGPGHDHEHD